MNCRLLLLSLINLMFATLASAQYSEPFGTPNKGYLMNCVNDITAVNWTLTPWDAGGTCQVIDLRDPADYFQTTAAGKLECIDLDQEVCWQSPLINISAAGTVSISVDLSWIGFDTDIPANNCSGDYIKVLYSINGGAYTMIPNQFGGNACATVAYPFGAPGAPFNNSGMVTQTGLSGNTLQIKVCVFTNANAESVTIDNVSVPEAGVTVGCAAPILSAVVTPVGCSNPSSGAIDLNVSGGNPGYTYDWSNDGPDTPDNDPQDLTGLTTGVYTVTVTDAAMCSSTISATVGNAPAIVFSTQVLNAGCSGSMDGEIDLIVSGGVPAYTYDWSNDGPETPDNDAQDLIGVGAGTYTVTVTDASGCTATTNVTVGAQSAGPYSETFSIPNKGYLLNQENDFSAVNWSMTPWTLDEPPAGIGRDNGDYFQTTAAGKLEAVDADQEICWVSPELNISTSGTVQFSVDLRLG